MSWARADAERKRAVPAATYRLFGYRIVKGDWMISTTGGRGEVELRRGADRALDVSSTVHVNLKARRQRGQVRVQFGITNGQHMGLSIYKEGKRVPLTYTLLDDAGNELASGSMQYG